MEPGFGSTRRTLPPVSLDADRRFARRQRQHEHCIGAGAPRSTTDKARKALNTRATRATACHLHAASGRQQDRRADSCCCSPHNSFCVIYVHQEVLVVRIICMKRLCVTELFIKCTILCCFFKTRPLLKIHGLILNIVGLSLL